MHFSSPIEWLIVNVKITKRVGTQKGVNTLLFIQNGHRQTPTQK